MIPVDLTYSYRDGTQHSGLAATTEQALAIAREQYSGDEWEPSSISVRLTSKEVGTTFRTREEFERVWADEIAEGWVTPTQVYGGWKGMAECYEISAREKD